MGTASPTDAFFLHTFVANTTHKSIREGLWINTHTSIKTSFNIHRWVKNYLHLWYMFCSWLCCWFIMTKYTWSTPLLPLWCRCDLDCPFLSWVFCHKHGHSQFHLHQRKAEASDPFLWAEGVPGVEMRRMMSVQYGNSVMSQRIVCWWSERFKNVRTSVKHGEGTGRQSTYITDADTAHTVENLTKLKVLEHLLYSLDLTP